MAIHKTQPAYQNRRQVWTSRTITKSLTIR